MWHLGFNDQETGEQSAACPEKRSFRHFLILSQFLLEEGYQ